ncbi:hypothetical protein RF11_12039 [Thelohanellus kitauei]|uniref:Uncharacterized protein n=1 Tax=Thelohanellus kitauei TaxID=669202 RepID=A0A0C2ITK4_THEKT|nr:hypothetical protein RF11_12039 [Thelohanellus kitauei]
MATDIIVTCESFSKLAEATTVLVQSTKSASEFVLENIIHGSGLPMNRHTYQGAQCEADLAVISVKFTNRKRSEKIFNVANECRLGKICTILTAFRRAPGGSTTLQVRGNCRIIGRRRVSAEMHRYMFEHLQSLVKK